ncbi:MAG: hypothetical protein AAGD07_05490 [Planctomycetota bacterium]
MGVAFRHHVSVLPHRRESQRAGSIDESLQPRYVQARRHCVTLLASLLLLPGIVSAQSQPESGDAAALSEDTSDVPDDASDTAPSEDEVSLWVDQLDAPQLATRRKAEQRLIEAGPRARVHLPVSTAHLSQEARLRLQDVIASWQRARSAEASRLDTIDLDGAETLGAALEAISLATEVEFEHNANENAPVVVPAGPLSFWQALDLLLDQSDLDVNIYGGDRSTLMLVPREEERPSRVDSAAYAGVYRMEPTTVTSRRVLGRPRLSGLNVTMTLAWQPNRTPIGLTIPVGELQANLSNGAPLQSQASGETIEIATTSDLTESEFVLPMELPVRRDPEVDAIARIQGRIQALMPGPRHKFSLKISQPGALESKDAMTVAIESVRPNGPLHEVRLRVTLAEAGDALESHRMWLLENDAHAESDDGTRLDHLGYQVYSQSPNEVGIGYLFDFGGSSSVDASLRLIYQSPVSVSQVAVPFMIEAIPLP